MIFLQRGLLDDVLKSKVCFWARFDKIRIAEGINFRGNAFRKVFADLIFVELGFFAACMHAILNSRF